MDIKQVIDNLKADIVDWSEEIECLKNHDRKLLREFCNTLRMDGTVARSIMTFDAGWPSKLVDNFLRRRKK